MRRKLLEYRRMQHTGALIVLLLLAPVRALGDDFGTWVGSDVTLLSGKNTWWTFTPTARFVDEEFARVTTQVSFRVAESAEIGVSYYQIRLRGGEEEWGERLRAHIAYGLVTLGANGRVTGSSIYERRFFDESPDLNLYRQTFDFVRIRQKHSPWVMQDYSFDDDKGFFLSRSRLGWNVNLSELHRLRVAYQFQVSKTTRDDQEGTFWKRQHAIYLELRLGRRPPPL